MVSVSLRRTGGDLKERTGRLLTMMFQNNYTLVLLNLLAILFLITRSQTDFNDYIDNSISSLNIVGDTIASSVVVPCPPEPPPTTFTAASRAMTTNIVEHNDADVHKTSTVMAMATGYELIDYMRFVGSLRKTGYLGNIILVVAPDMHQREESYLLQKNVILHKVQYVNCSQPVDSELIKKDKNELDSHEREMLTCVHPYPTLKNRWARFPLLRDLLMECGGKPNPEVACGGPVLITDMRDTFFQRNPFGPEAPKVTGLQVFEEHYTIRTTHWLVDWPVFDCKGVRFDKPMLCSGTTIGTRQAMLEYLDIFHGEMGVWMQSPKCCCFETNGDDQSMHNYMYYSGMLDGVTGGVQAVKNRNGIVHTVGAAGALIQQTSAIQKSILRKANNHPRPNDGHDDSFDLSSEEDPSTSKNWLGLHYGMTDADGYFVEFDGSRSFVVHQYDRFGHNFIDWMMNNSDHLFLP